MLENTVSLEHGLPFPLFPCPENLPGPAQKPMDECRRGKSQPQRRSVTVPVTHHLSDINICLLETAQTNVQHDISDPRILGCSMKHSNCGLQWNPK